eukprot:1160432-Pelagomonas_calceolata.AAC.13
MPLKYSAAVYDKLYMWERYEGAFCNTMLMTYQNNGLSHVLARSQYVVAVLTSTLGESAPGYVVAVYDKPMGERHKGAFYNGSGDLLLNQVISIGVIMGWTGAWQRVPMGSQCSENCYSTALCLVGRLWNVLREHKQGHP